MPLFQSTVSMISSRLPDVFPSLRPLSSMPHLPQLNKRKNRFNGAGKISAPQNPRVSLFPARNASQREAGGPFFGFTPEETCSLSTSAPDQAATLKVFAGTLFDPFFHEFSIPLYSDSFGFTKMEEEIFDGLFC